MNKFRRWMSFIFVFALVFTLASPFNSANAASLTDKKELEDGRVQLTFEFKDMKEAEWAAEYIAKMKAKNVLAGYEDGTFRPNAPVKRVEAIATAVRLMGKEAEAKAKAADAVLHFKDAEQLSQKYGWAKGYVIVALENGLFDASEDKLQPEKPASRVWISSLLIRALGLQDDALKLMSETPDFKDAKQIPAGSIGYVNVAVQKDLIKGYPDGSFKPNKSVTRAELAVLLDKTNDGLNENDGAVTVTGIVKALVFKEETTDQTADGQITISSSNNQTFTYGINKDLLVQSGKTFIRADQLKLDDAVTVVVKDNKVIEAALLDKEVVEEELATGIRELKLELEAAKYELELKYKNRKGKVELKVEQKDNKGKTKLSKEDAEQFVSDFIKKSGLKDDMKSIEAIDKLLAALEISKDEIKELEFEVKFSNGKKLSAEFDEKDDDDDRKKRNNKKGR